MWKIILKDDFKFVCGYYIGESKAIHLWQYEEYYCCHVYDLDHAKRFYYFLRDESLEALKFKALLKAKETGWNISILNLRASEDNEMHMDT